MMRDKPGKYYFIFIFILFVFSTATYFYVGLKEPALISVLLRNLPDLSAFMDNSPIENFALIFFNNAFKSLMVILVGVLFGVFPIYFIFVNGQIIGMVAALVYRESGILVLLAGLLPHGITETIAIVLSGGYGLWLGTKFYASIFKKEKKQFKEAFRYSLRKYVRLIVPLFLVSALIEAFITPFIMRFAGGL